MARMFATVSYLRCGLYQEQISTQVGFRCDLSDVRRSGRTPPQKPKPAQDDGVSTRPTRPSSLFTPGIYGFLKTTSLFSRRLIHSSADCRCKAVLRRSQAMQDGPEASKNRAAFLAEEQSQVKSGSSANWPQQTPKIPGFRRKEDSRPRPRQARPRSIVNASIHKSELPAAFDPNYPPTALQSVGTLVNWHSVGRTVRHFQQKRSFMMSDTLAPDLTKFGIGQPVLREEDPDLLCGKGHYSDDHNVQGQAYAYFLRSPVAHGTIVSLDVSEALKSPGVLAVYTGEDLRRAGIKDIPSAVPVKGRDGSDARIPPRPALATGQVKHVGDPVAAVVADTLEQARDAAERIHLAIDPLPAVSNPLEAVRQGAARVWHEIPGNVCLDFHLGDEEAVEKAFAEASHITRLELNNTRMVVNAMEPRAAVAEHDDGKFTLTVGTQGVTGYRNTIASILGVENDQMRVISREVGGSFGMKGSAFNEAIVILHAARQLDRPVKWTSDRTESFLSDHHGRASTLSLALACDPTGRFLGLKVEGVGDLGAYLTAMGIWPPTIVTSRNMISVYRTPAFSYSARCVFTNTVPTGPYRGAGRPESKFFVERLIDKAALELGIDRIELRRRNMISPDEMPYQTPVDWIYDSGEFASVMDKALHHADYAGFPTRKNAAEADGKLRGIGIAPYLENTAASGSELADIRFEADGSVTLVTGTKDFGMGHVTPFKQILMERLGIPFDRIRIIQFDSDEMSAGAGGSGGSRSIIATGGAIIECSERIIEKGRRLASHLLEAAEEDISFSEGNFTVTGTDRSVNILDLARATQSNPDRPSDLPDTLSEKVNHTTHPSSYPNGCHIAEVEIDPDTGVVQIDRYTVVDDFGVVVNPPVVEGQVHGGIMQGVGQVIGEDTAYDADGQLLSASYMDYAMPRADDLCSIEFLTHPVPCQTNPLGVKGCGEAGNGGSFPAVYNAVMDALSGRIDEELGLPATPYRIWKALRTSR